MSATEDGGAGSAPAAPWTVDWHPAVRHDMLALHRSGAKQMIAAIVRFAESGEGHVEVLGGGRYSLRVAGGVSFFDVDPGARRLRVLRALATW